MKEKRGPKPGMDLAMLYEELTRALAVWIDRKGNIWLQYRTPPPRKKE